MMEHGGLQDGKRKQWRSLGCRPGALWPKIKEKIKMSGIQGHHLRSKEFPLVFPFSDYATPTPGQENYQPMGSRFESELDIGMIQ